MPKFSKRSRTHLDECHPDLIRVMEEAIKIIDFSVIEGHRPEAEQMKAYHAKKSKVKWPDSKHNKKPSHAVDIIPYPFTGWNDSKTFYFMAGHIVATAKLLYATNHISHLIRWGGDWDKDNDLNDQTFRDLVHFEIYKPKIKQQ